MSRKKHTIPLGTKVSFDDDPYVYTVVDYQELLYCDSGCSWDHDCYEEPYITVSKEARTGFPISKLKFVYNNDGIGVPIKEFLEKQKYSLKGYPGSLRSVILRIWARKNFRRY